MEEDDHGALVEPGLATQINQPERGRDESPATLSNQQHMRVILTALIGSPFCRTLVTKAAFSWHQAGQTD